MINATRSKFLIVGAIGGENFITRPKGGLTDKIFPSVKLIKTPVAIEMKRNPLDTFCLDLFE